MGSRRRRVLRGECVPAEGEQKPRTSSAQALLIVRILRRPRFASHRRRRTLRPGKYGCSSRSWGGEELGYFIFYLVGTSSGGHR